jgi:hypothetical protein
MSSKVSQAGDWSRSYRGHPGAIIVRVIAAGLSLLVLAGLALGQSNRISALPPPVLDYNFAAQTYYGARSAAGCNNSFSTCIKFSSSAGLAQNNAGAWSSFAANTQRITDLGQLIEPTATNYITNALDFTQASWTKTSVTAVFNQADMMGDANRASLLTASAASATACTSLTLSQAPGAFSIFVKRSVGTGTISLSMETDRGHSTTVLYALKNLSSSAFRRYFVVTDQITNPTLCVNIATSGDAVIVTYAQYENTQYYTSPIKTTGATVTRDADLFTFQAGVNTLMAAGTFSIVLELSNGVGPNHYILGGGSAGILHCPGCGTYLQLYSESNADNAYAVQTSAAAAIVAPFGGNVGLSGGTIVQPLKIGAISDLNQVCAVINGGSPTCVAGNGQAAANYGIANSLNGYLKRIRIWETKLTVGQIQQATLQIMPAAGVTDTNVAWTNVTTGSVVTINSNKFTQTSGTNYDPATGSYPMQMGPTGVLQRFNMFAANCSVVDSCRNFGGTERTEVAYNGRFPAQTDLWTSYSVCVEPGPTNVWGVPLAETGGFMILGQWHQDTGGNNPAFALNLLGGPPGGEFFQVEAVQHGGTTFAPVANAYMASGHGKWQNIVIQVNFDTTAVSSKVNVWINGTQIAKYTRETGVTNNSNTYYWKFGIYRAQSNLFAAVRYANMLMGTRSLASKISAPDIIPGGYGTTCQ